MSADLSAAPTNQQAEHAAEIAAAGGEWAETALTVLLTAAAVLFVSFIAVVTGLV